MSSAARPGGNTHTTTSSSGGGGAGRPPHAPPHSTPSASVVKVNSRQICFDVSKQRYSMSPHDKDPHRKLQSGRRLRGNESSAQGSGAKDTATATLASDLDASSGQGSDEGLTPPMSAAQCTAQRIIRLLLDWDPNRPLGEPGVFGALVGGLLSRVGLGGVSGGLKFKEASTSLVLADVRSSIQVASAEGKATKTDFDIGGWGWTGATEQLRSYYREVLSAERQPALMG